MATYPIRMMKDEQGMPFVPLTHMNAVMGDEYTIAPMTANKISNSHYKITNNELEIDDLKKKLAAISFDDISGVSTPCYMSLNNSSEYPIYNINGITELDLSSYSGVVSLFEFTGDKWKLGKIGSSAQSGGHGITDESGNLMPQRLVLNFSGFNVTDDSGNGATKISSKHDRVISEVTNSNITLTNSTWTNLLTSDLSINDTGYYRITVYVLLNTITSVSREIGVDINGDIEWSIQYTRFGHTYSTIKGLTVGDIVNPKIYIDPLTSSDSATINSVRLVLERVYN